VSVRFPLAFLLGVAAAVLLACGGSNKKLLPAVSADRLKNDLADVRQAVDQQDCSAAGKAFSAFESDLQRVPPTVDRRLRARLNEGKNRLAPRIPIDCNQPTTSTSTVPTTTTTTTTTAPTTTTPPPTTTTPTTTTPTTTTPTDTTTTDTTTTAPSNGGTPPVTTP
jgi:hypothetical protein